MYFYFAACPDPSLSLSLSLAMPCVRESLPLVPARLDTAGSLAIDPMRYALIYSILPLLFPYSFLLSRL